MKSKLITILLLCLCFVGCGNKQETPVQEESIIETTNVETTSQVTSHTTKDIITTTVLSEAITVTTNTTSERKKAVLVESISRESGSSVQLETPITEIKIQLATQNSQSTTTKVTKHQEQVEISTQEDNSYEIIALQHKINSCNSNISLYESYIASQESLIVTYQSSLDYYNSQLEQAKIEVTNVQNNKVRVYTESGGWEYRVDAGALAEAEADVDYYQGFVDSYAAKISSCNEKIKNYKSQIAIEESNITIYQSQIDSLQ